MSPDEHLDRARHHLDRAYWHLRGALAWFTISGACVMVLGVIIGHDGTRDAGVVWVLATGLTLALAEISTDREPA